MTVKERLTTSRGETPRAEGAGKIPDTDLHCEVDVLGNCWTLHVQGEGHQALQEALGSLLKAGRLAGPPAEQDATARVLRGPRAIRARTSDRAPTEEDRVRAERLKAVLMTLGSGPWSSGALAAALGCTPKSLRVFTNSLARCEKPSPIESTKVRGGAGWKRRAS